MPRRNRRSQKVGIDLELMRKNDELQGWVPPLITSVLGTAFSGSAQWSDTRKSKLWLWITRDGEYCSLDQDQINALVDHLLQQEPLSGEIQLYLPSGAEADRWQRVYSKPKIVTETVSGTRAKVPWTDKNRPWYLQEGGR